LAFMSIFLRYPNFNKGNPTPAKQASFYKLAAFRR